MLQKRAAYLYSMVIPMTKLKLRPSPVTDMIPILQIALRDMLALYDRAAGNVRTDHGWTAADIQRINEIRSLVHGSRVTDHESRE